MKIIFFGSSEFAVPVLEALKDREEVSLVVTQPDRKKGRYLKKDSTAVKKLAGKIGIEVFQPPDVNAKDSIERLRAIGAELFVVVSFGQILKKEVLDIPKIPINVHASLLPKYRGAAPINWAIANGEKETGVTIMRMNENMDQGDIILKEAVSIGAAEDAVALSQRLSRKGGEALLRAVDLIKKGAASFEKQIEAKATYAPKLKKEDGLIDWSWDAEEICNRVRAFVPWPGCFTYWDKKVLKIYKAEPHAESKTAKPGTVLEVARDGILVSAGKGAVMVEELQPESKRRMKAEEFIAGHKNLTPGLYLTK